jgi:hypothetical protein
MNADTQNVLAIADQIMKHARESIDAQFGEGYAAGHQLLLIKYLDGVFSLLAATTKKLPE